MAAVMPRQRPGRSRQDYCTPRPFVEAVKRRLGIADFAYDFAADAENTVAPVYICEAQDAMTVLNWENLIGPGWGWLNPPFAHIAPWAMRCAQTGRAGAHIALLTPAAVGANWFRDHVAGQARVLFLNGRLAFTDEPYPKDCVLSLYGPTIEPGYEVWSWRARTTVKARKKPVTVDVIHYTGRNAEQVLGWSGAGQIEEGVERQLRIPTLEGTMMIASPGDWIIRGVAGELYPCKDHIFKQTYDMLPNNEA